MRQFKGFCDIAQHMLWAIKSENDFMHGSSMADFFDGCIAELEAYNMTLKTELITNTLIHMRLQAFYALKGLLKKRTLEFTLGPDKEIEIVKRVNQCLDSTGFSDIAIRAIANDLNSIKN